MPRYLRHLFQAPEVQPVGIIMARLAYVIPGIISDVIVTPAGGESLRVESTATDCDNLLKTQLVQQVNFPDGEAGHVGGGTVVGVGGAPRGIGGAGVFVRRRHRVSFPFRWRFA